MKLVTILGGSGFVGRMVARRMALEGWRVRVACRHPNRALGVRVYGPTGQVEPIFANIRDDASVRAVVRGAGAVVNCVGVLEEAGRNTFGALQRDGAERAARIADAEGAATFVQLSAIGADAASRSDYARTKGEGEELVRDRFPGAVILRPSIVFGAEDKFFNRFAAMARFSPMIPVVGANTRFQPVYVDDVAAAAAEGATGRARPGTYEIGGPDVMTFRELMDEMLSVIGRRRAVVNVPFWMAHLMGWGFDTGHRLTFGLLPRQITRDQVRNLRRDNVASGRWPGLAELGVEPTSMEAVLPEYLWRFRKGGQYAVTNQSLVALRARERAQGGPEA